MKTILFVCTGNTCRSAMAMAVARTYPKIYVFSRGLGALDGTPISDNAKKALEVAKIQVPLHKARQLRKEDVARLDSIFVMTKLHLKDMSLVYPEAISKTFLLNKWSDIQDPFGDELEPYIKCLKEIQDSVKYWLTDPK